jgi:hypothetical protein
MISQFKLLILETDIYIQIHKTQGFKLGILLLYFNLIGFLPENIIYSLHILRSVLKLYVVKGKVSIGQANVQNIYNKKSWVSLQTFTKT